MNKNTPKNKPVDDSRIFLPVLLQTSPAAGSPQKNLTGPPRIVRDIIADLYNNIQKWNTLHINGCALVKQIASIKADEPKSYSTQLEDYVNDLYTVTESLKENYNIFAVLINQTEAFAKLLNIPNPVFFSLDALSIAQLVQKISEAYRQEFQVKKFVLQHIAHAKNKNEVMFLATCWTHQLNVGENVVLWLESLLVETGHRPIK